MMKKLLIIFTVSLFSGITQAQLTWQSGNLLGLDDFTAASDGWLVQMFRDANSDTDLSTLSFDDNGVASGVNAGDDSLLTSFTTTLNYTDDFFGINLLFSEIYQEFSSIYGASVYTVILNESSWANATPGVSQTFVLDESTYTVPGANPGQGNYNPPNNNPGGHEWQTVIPEPGTMALLVIGMTGLFGLRRKLFV